MTALMSSGNAEKLVVPTRPRLLVEPPAITSSLGAEAVDLAADAGLQLDPWQQADLTLMLAERADGKWAARDFGHIVARQNGKGSTLEARELAGLFLVGDPLSLHSAHLAVTSKEAFLRLLSLIENTPWLMKRVRRVSHSTQDMSITLTSGARILFKTRTKGGGRGLTGDLVVLDEAYQLYHEQIAALLPTTSARPNPQVIYASSAGMADSEVLHQLRRRALAARDGVSSDGGLAYCEYSPDPLDPGFDPDDPAVWAQANPALGIRISVEAIAAERRAMSDEVFLRERLSIFDEEPTEANESPLSAESWGGCRDEGSEIVGPVAIAIDVNPARSKAAIGGAGRNPGGKLHGEVIDFRTGTDWVAGRVLELRQRNPEIRIVAIDPGGPAGSLIDPLTELGVEVTTVTAREHAQACGLLFDSVESGSFAHLGQADLDAAVRSARRRDLGDAWAWRRGSGSDAPDITQLVAVTIAVGQVAALAEPEPSKPVFAY